MSLEDLSQYATTQTAAINHLIDLGYFTSGPISLAWKEFKKSVWKKGLGALQVQEPVERDDDPVGGRYGYIEDDAVPATTLVTTIPDTLPDVWHSASKRILVRSDYLEAEQAALSASESGKEVFVATGQPGIGKTFFLLWLLIRRLALGLPTALQINSDYAILFHEYGVSQFAYLELNEVYAPLTSPGPSRIWTLVVSSRDLTQPGRVFRNGAPFFVVEAASPRPLHFQWLGEANSQYFYMKRWSISEVLQTRSFLGDSAPYTERQLWHLHEVYGASTRALARHARDPTNYERAVAEQVRSLESPTAMGNAVMSQYSDDSTNLFVVFDCSETSRTEYSKTFASKSVFQKWWDQYWAQPPHMGFDV